MPGILLPFADVRANGFQVVVEFRRLLLAHLPDLVHDLIFHHKPRVSISLSATLAALKLKSKTRACPTDLKRSPTPYS